MSEPTPVTPLSYYERASEPWLPMTRWMSIAAIADSSVFLLSFIVHMSFFSWPLFSSSFLGNTQGRLQIVLELPAATAAVVLLIGASLTLRVRGGLKMVSIGAIAFAVTLLIEATIRTLSSFFRYPSGNRVPIVTFILLWTVLSSLQRCVAPILIWFYFRRPAVVELFEAARG